jgi:hypothetical protein
LLFDLHHEVRHPGRQGGCSLGGRSLTLIVEPMGHGHCFEELRAGARELAVSLVAIAELEQHAERARVELPSCLELGAGVADLACRE